MNNKISAIKITKDFDSISVLSLLSHHFKISKILVHKLIRKNQILLNGEVVKTASIKVFEGQELTFKKPVEIIEQTQEEIPQSYIDAVKSMIFFENDDVIAINKLYGFSVQGGEGIRNSIDKVMLQLYNARIVHRIDKETSGIVVFAKNILTARKISKLFQDNLVKKTYIAQVSGVSKKDKFESTRPIFDKDKNKDLQSHTFFEVISKNEENNTTLLKVNPITGRKHQIRIHLSYLDLPIIGDSKYSYDRRNKLHLFAKEISIPNIVNLKLDDLPLFFG